MVEINGVKKQDVTSKFAIYCGDSCEVMQSIPDNSLHF